MNDKKKMEITIFALAALFMISMAVNYIQMNHTNRLEDKLLTETLRTSLDGVDLSHITTAPIVWEPQEKEAIKFRAIWTIQYNAEGLPEIGELDQMIRQNHIASCIVDVELVKLGSVGTAILAVGELTVGESTTIDFFSVDSVMVDTTGYWEGY